MWPDRTGAGGQGTHLGVLGILGPQVLVQVADDVRRDLEGAEEHEEEAEEDVEAADDEALAHPAPVQVAAKQGLYVPRVLFLVLIRKLPRQEEPKELLNYGGEIDEM